MFGFAKVHRAATAPSTSASVDYPGSSGYMPCKYVGTLPRQKGRRTAMLKRLSGLALPTIITWGIILSVNLIPAGPALAGIIIGNG
jgi:hypothetical protein